MPNQELPSIERLDSIFMGLYNVVLKEYKDMEEKKNEKPVKLDSNKFTEDLSFAFIMYKDKDMESVKHLLVGDYFGVISALLGTVNALREQGVISDDLLLDILNIKDCRGGK